MEDHQGALFPLHHLSDPVKEQGGIVKVQGSVSADTAAVDAAARTAESISGLINKHIIARPTDDSQKMANRTSVGRDKVGHIPNNA